MIHRPTDSRLLTNLLSQEKEYTKQLSVVLEYSQVSLSSFSAYASASPPPASQAILSVAASLAGANEALEKYATSVNEWRDQLIRVRDLEGEVGNIMRDREILVTRLLKASKQQKPTRDSLVSLPGSPGVKGDGSSKINIAQSELQACEAHLANKERELNGLRLSAIRGGLHARCKAMVECGWTWGEMGKEGIRALEKLDAPNGHAMSYPSSSSPSKTATDPYKTPSDLSSILPSQSASQIALVGPPGPSGTSNNVASPPRPPDRPYSLEIPPAHAISELTLPLQYNGGNPEDGDGSSSTHESLGPVEVHENERFGSGRSFSIRPKNKGKKRTKEAVANGHANPGPHPGPDPQLPNGSPVRGKDRDRKASSGVFGNLAGLFHRSSPARGRWQTRNDRNVKDGSDSDDDVTYLAVPKQANGYAKHGTVPTRSRLRKPAKNRAFALDSFAHGRPYNSSSALVPPSGNPGLTFAPVKGKGKATATDIDNEFSTPSGSAEPFRTLIRRASSSHPNLPLTAGGTSLSRESSLSKKSQMSSMSAPPATNVVFRPRSGANVRLPATPRKRTTSASVPSATSVGWAGHNRSGSLDSGPIVLTPAQPNLMSIVEEAVRQNREARNLANPNNRLESVKAPPSASAMLSREAQFSMAQTQPPPPLQRASVSPSKPIGSSASSVKIDARAEKRPQQLQQPTPVAATSQTSELLTHVSRRTASLSPAGGVANQPLSAKLPLKSALRIPSRTPSPTPLARNRHPVVPPTTNPSPPPINSPSSEDDTISISSYITVGEVFESENETTPTEPPPHDSHLTNGVGTSDVSHSTSSTTTAGGTRAPSRRKSVRMSLPPTYSTTPPAIEEWEGDRDKFPWAFQSVGSSKGWISRNSNTVDIDIWENSSDEDEEYSTARTMLNKVAGKDRH